MITKAQALSSDTFHFGYCTRTTGPRGGITVKQETWRRNGQTQTWKTRPDEFRVPIKYGLYSCSQLWHHDAEAWHTAEDCPLNQSGDV